MFSLPEPTSSVTTDSQELHENDVPISFENYEERYIAFIDILGFKELVKKSVNEPATLSLLFNAFNLNFTGMSEFYATLHEQSPGLRVSTFSDFVVVSCDANETGLEYLIFVVWHITTDWLSKGFLSRGGITKGKVIHAEAEDNTPALVFGPAFIEAYQLEQLYADYPRVILSREARTDVLFYRSQATNHESPLFKLVSLCKDGPMCVDIYGHLRVDGYDTGGRDNTSEAGQFHKTLSEHLDAGADIPKWYMKTKWLVEHFNKAITGTSYADLSLPIEM